MSLKPRTPCWIRSKTETFDIYGRPSVSMKSRRTKCAIVSLYDEVQPTAVRHDSAASQSRIEEQTASARILLLPREQVKTGDVIEVSGIKFEVKRIFRRPDVSGKIHHIDVEGEIWASD